MKKSLNYLPRSKRDELIVIVDTILKECPTVQMLVLFGPCARGDMARGHEREFNILVIARPAKVVADARLWRKVEKRIRQSPGRTPMRLLVQTLEAVNEAIVGRNALFNDIKSEGIVLYKKGRPRLANTRRISRSERKRQAQAN
jgi:hypothetical protein